MGGIVKSIGRTVKKLGKGIGRFLKKYRTTIILAAALWAGLGAFGAGLSKASIWSPRSVGWGLKRLFSPAVASGLPIAPGATEYANPNWLDWSENPSKFADSMSKGTSVLSGLKKWFSGMPEWGKYALTQTGMTIVGSMLDKSAEEEMAAKYGGMGLPYGSTIEDPTAIFKEHPEWMVPSPPTYGDRASTSQTSTPQQASLMRAPATVGPPRSQQIASMPTTPLDVRPPGMISGRSPGLIPMGASQRRYA